MKLDIFKIAVLLSVLFIVILSSCTRNKLPDTPSVLTGPSGGVIGDTLIFTLTAIDPDNDSIAIRINWDDGNETDWSPFVPSGDSVIMQHSYSSTGSFQIKAQAKDIHNAISNWLVLDTIEIGRIRWTMVTDSAAWSKRANHSADVFNNKIWVLGGNNKNDVWYGIIAGME